MKRFTLIVLLLQTVVFGQTARHLSYADSICKANHIPELSYAVVTADKVLELATMGHHSVNLPDTATLQDRFHIGSNTKAMTAFIIAKYVEKGKLKWDTKFFSLFPEWQSHSNEAYYNITLLDLLTHRARIQPFQGEDDVAIPKFEGSQQAKRKAFGEFVLTLMPVEVDAENKFVYSNAGYTLAALMLEKVTNKSWEQLVKRVFVKELKINTQFALPNNQTRKDTWGHSWENEQLTPVASSPDFHLDLTEPAGDLNVTLPDYLKFVQLNLQGLAGKDNFLKADTYRFLHKGVELYSLGWYNSYENGKDFSTHAGTATTYYTLVAIDRKNYIGYIIFTNVFNQDIIIGVRNLMRKLKADYTK